MQEDFHYYATYCAASLAGYSVEESERIAYSAQFVDHCTRTILSKVKGPLAAATTQTQGELAQVRTDLIGLQDITRIWASFHFLPYNLYAPVKAGSPAYRAKYHLICKPNSDLMVKTVNLAKGKSLESVGLAMHVLADTWAHAYFAGTTSQVINNTNIEFYEILPGDFADSVEQQRRIIFTHNISLGDDMEKGIFINTMNNGNENSIMNLGHGRAGHLPDYSYIRYEYLPAWGNYHSIVKDNPSDYMHAFQQMVAAMKYLRGDKSTFQKNDYEEEALREWKKKIHEILTKRQLDACEDWKKMGKEITGVELKPFDLEEIQKEYQNAAKEEKDDTTLGRFIIAAMRQKSMVTNSIFASGNMLAGISVDYRKKGFRGIKDFKKLVELFEKRGGAE